MVLVIGEVLVDIFPKYRRIGGAPFNFAYHLKQFGIPVAFVSRIGEDDLGSQILDTLKRSGFDSSRIQIDPAYPTGHVTVTPDGTGGHEFDIVPDVAYDHIQLPEKPESMVSSGGIDLIYFGTLMQRSPSAHSRMQTFLSNRNNRSRCFYDINLRPGCFNHEIIENSLKHVDILKLNEDEIEYIRDMFHSRLDCGAFVGWLMETYDIKLLALTRGADGSEIYTRETRHSGTVPENQDIVDTVGAGDAYSAVLALGYLKKWPPDRILSMGIAFASAICGIKGAVPQEPSFYEPFMSQITGEQNG